MRLLVKRLLVVQESYWDRQCIIQRSFVTYPRTARVFPASHLDEAPIRPYKLASSPICQSKGSRSSRYCASDLVKG
jgi:hypothetical protein